jgi:hypothetical protein
MRPSVRLSLRRKQMSRVTGDAGEMRATKPPAGKQHRQTAAACTPCLGCATSNRGGRGGGGGGVGGVG